MKKNFLAFLAMALCLSFATIGCNNDDDDNVTPNPDSDFTFQEDNLGYVVTKYIGSSSNVVIPSTYKGKTVHTIGDSCFYLRNNTELVKSVTIPTSIKKINILAFWACRGLTTIDIPNSVETIESGAFEIAGVKSITIGTGIKTMGGSPFAGCNDLTNLRINAVNPPQLDNDIFSGGPQMKEISVPQASLNAYKTANIWQLHNAIIVGH